MSVFSLRFACQAQTKARQNVAVQCACGPVCAGECVDVCLRVCRDIQTGTELLLYEDAERGNQTADRAEDTSSGQTGSNYRQTVAVHVSM